MIFMHFCWKLLNFVWHAHSKIFRLQMYGSISSCRNNALLQLYRPLIFFIDFHKANWLAKTYYWILKWPSEFDSWNLLLLAGSTTENAVQFGTHFLAEFTHLIFFFIVVCKFWFREKFVLLTCIIFLGHFKYRAVTSCRRRQRQLSLLTYKFNGLTTFKHFILIRLSFISSLTYRARRNISTCLLPHAKILPTATVYQLTENVSLIYNCQLLNINFVIFF